MLLPVSCTIEKLLAIPGEKTDNQLGERHILGWSLTQTKTGLVQLFTHKA